MQQRPALSLDSGVFYNGIEGISIRVANKDAKTGELTDVLIYDHREKAKGNRTVVRAQKGLMEQTEDKRFLVMTLYNGYSYDEPLDRTRKQSEQALIESHFEKNVLRLDLSSFAFQANNEEVFKNSYEMMTINQLGATIDSLEIQYDSTLSRLSRNSLDQLHVNKPAYEATAGSSLQQDMSEKDRTSALQIAQEITRRNKDGLTARQDELDAKKKFLARHEIEWHRKFYLAIVCVVLFFIGAPLGAIIRKGGLGMPTVIALALFIFYQLLTIAGEKMTKSMIIDAWLGMWMSTAILLPLSIWLTLKASKEAVLMDKDNYSRWFKKLSALWKRKPKEMNA
jgi:lipopolysaccharide export system permease protein